MKRHFTFSFLGVFALTCALFALAATAQPKESQPMKPSPAVATTDTMNGYALKDYADFWKDHVNWHFVTVRYRKDTGEMRLTYANDLAWKALQAGGKEYPDGAVFAKMGLMTQEDPSFTSSAVPAGARRYQLMVRDKEKWKDTNGWGYALFDGKGKAVKDDQDIASMACYACHALVPERADVFSQIWQPEIGGIEGIPIAQPVPRVEFKTVEASTLPAKIRDRLKGFDDARLIQGKLALSLFRGTIDEIRPTISRETVRSGKPALLMSVDGTLFSVVYVDATDKACKLAGGKDGVKVKGFYTTGIVPGKDSLVADHEHCEGK